MIAWSWRMVYTYDVHAEERHSFESLGAAKRMNLDQLILMNSKNWPMDAA
jgi:hypothetical protein